MILEEIDAITRFIPLAKKTYLKFVKGTYSVLELTYTVEEDVSFQVWHFYYVLGLYFSFLLNESRGGGKETF